MNGTQFNVSTGPSSAANVRCGIYAADSNLQPTGAPLLDSGNVAVGSSATGMFIAAVSPTVLQPGMYLTAFNTSQNLTVRVQRGGITGSNFSQGSNSLILLNYGSQTQGAFPNPGTPWTVPVFGATGMEHMLLLRWKDAP